MMGVTISLGKGRWSMNCLAAMLLGQKHTGVWKRLQWLMGSLRHGGDESKIIRAAKAASAFQRVPYQGRLDKDRTESRIFHLTDLPCSCQGLALVT